MKVRRFLRLSSLVIVLGLAVALAGCGGGDGASTAVSGEPISFEGLSKAATASSDAQSGRFSFSMEATMPGTSEPFAFSGEGAFDAVANRAALSFDFSSFAELLGGMFAGLAGPGAQDGPDFGDPSAWKIDAVQDGDVVYMRFPAIASELPDGKSWVRVDATDAASAHGFDFGQLQDLGGNDPRQALELLRAASKEIETVGAEELRGVQTTHYRATVDLAKYEQLVPAAEREKTGEMVEGLLEQAGLAGFPVDVWVDGSGLVRRMEVSLAAQPDGTEPVEANITFELWDYGEAVDVELPPADEVADASALD